MNIQKIYTHGSSLVQKVVLLTNSQNTLRGPWAGHILKKNLSYKSLKILEVGNEDLPVPACCNPPWEPTTFIFRAYMKLGSKSWYNWFLLAPRCCTDLYENCQCKLQSNATPRRTQCPWSCKHSLASNHPFKTTILLYIYGGFLK